MPIESSISWSDWWRLGREGQFGGDVRVFSGRRNLRWLALAAQGRLCWQHYYYRFFDLDNVYSMLQHFLVKYLVHDDGRGCH